MGLFVLSVIGELKAPDGVWTAVLGTVALVSIGIVICQVQDLAQLRKQFLKCYGQDVP